MFNAMLAALVAGARWPWFPAAATAEELKVPDNLPTDKFDFEAKSIEGWKARSRACGFLVTISFPGAARAADPDWKAVEQTLGRI